MHPGYEDLKHCFDYNHYGFRNSMDYLNCTATDDTEKPQLRQKAIWARKLLKQNMNKFEDLENHMLTIRRQPEHCKNYNYMSHGLKHMMKLGKIEPEEDLEAALSVTAPDPAPDPTPAHVESAAITKETSKQNTNTDTVNTAGTPTNNEIYT